MSTFGVTIETIERVWNHPNADKLDLATIKGMAYQFVIGRDQYAEGDAVLYFPIDSLLPDPLIEELGLTGRLAGKAKNRVKTIKLRGEISQGIVAKFEDFAERIMQGIDDDVVSIPESDPPALFGMDVAPVLGVCKYEAPEPLAGYGSRGTRPAFLRPLPDLVRVYDIEGADRHTRIAELLADMPVAVTEKMEGSHFAATLLLDNGQPIEGGLVVCQRRYAVAVQNPADHVFTKMAEVLSLESVLRYIRVIWAANAKQSVTLRGEIVGAGIQGNIYALPTHRVYFFEIEIDGKPISARWFFDTMKQVQRVYPHIDAVPLLTPLVNVPTLREWLDDAAHIDQRDQADLGGWIRAASNGYSAIWETLREGIVIRPFFEEQEIDRFGRLILKQRSPEYLAGSDA